MNKEKITVPVSVNVNADTQSILDKVAAIKYHADIIGNLARDLRYGDNLFDVSASENIGKE